MGCVGSGGGRAGGVRKQTSLVEREAVRRWVSAGIVQLGAVPFTVLVVVVELYPLGLLGDV